MINVKKLVQSALECLGWPYVSPGTNDQRGIDCSGLWVKCFRDQGGKIYHGSNTIFREYCTETGKLTSEKQLRVGMAVFKRKDWTNADRSNKWYGKDPGNLSHIGMVTSVNPLVITHATSPVCKQDFKIGNWAYWGKVKGVDYGSDPGPSPEPTPEPTPTPAPDPEPTPVLTTATVWAENGKPVKMRAKPSTQCGLYDTLPVGTEVQVVKYGDTWTTINYGRRKGWYIMTKFLSVG